VKKLLPLLALLFLHHCEEAYPQTLMAYGISFVSASTNSPSTNYVNYAVIPTNRLIDWTKAGVPGGIVSRTVTAAVMNSGTTEASIQAALDAAPSNSVVILNAGTYSLTAQLTLSNSYTTLRGSGGGTTTYLIASSANNDLMINIGKMGGLWSGQTNQCGSYTWTPYSNNWVAGFAQGSTTIYVAANSTTNQLAPGIIIGLDQLDDGVNTVTPSGGGNTTAYFRGCATFSPRGLTEYKMITAIVSNQITLDRPLYSPYWNLTNIPAVFWPSTNPANYTVGVSIENVTINGNGYPQFPLFFGPTFSCWAYNVTVESNLNTGTGASLIGTSGAKNFEIRHCTFTDQLQPSDSGDYVIRITNGSDFRVEDNIIQNYYNPLIMYGCSGGVLGYNYCTNDLDVNTAGNLNCDCSGPTANFFAHGGQVHFNLVEGNYARAKTFFNLTGYETWGTVFRNRLCPKEKATDAAFFAFRIMENSWYDSVVGNVLGSPGATALYEGYYNATNGDAGNEVYNFNGTNGYTFASDTRANDPKVTNTLFREGNYDTVSGSNVWRTIASQSISNSLGDALGSNGKPSWWTNTTLPFPPFDPNVTTNLVTIYPEPSSRIPRHTRRCRPAMSAEPTSPKNNLNTMLLTIVLAVLGVCWISVVQ
jgi:hypothetical protein